MAYKLTQTPKHAHIAFEDGREFRAYAVHAWGRTYWNVEEWNEQKNMYEFSGKEKTACEAIHAILAENENA